MNELQQLGLHNVTSAILGFNKAFGDDPKTELYEDAASGITVRKTKNAYEITVPNYNEIAKPKSIIQKVISHIKMRDIGRVSFFAEKHDALIRVEKQNTF